MAASPSDEEIDAMLRESVQTPDGEPAVDLDALLAFSHGELDDAGRKEVEDTLARSAAARDFLAELRRSPPTAQVAQTERLLLRRQNLRRRVSRALSLAVLAAGVALYVIPSDPMVSSPSPYQVAHLTGGIQPVRSTAGVSHTFGPDSRFELVVVPAQEPARIAVGGRVFVAGPDGASRAVEIDTTARDGALTFRGDAARMFAGPPGRRRIYIALASDASVLTDLAPPTAESLPTAGDALQWVQLEIEYLGQRP